MNRARKNSVIVLMPIKFMQALCHRASSLCGARSNERISEQPNVPASQIYLCSYTVGRSLTGIDPK